MVNDSQNNLNHHCKGRCPILGRKAITMQYSDLFVYHINLYTQQHKLPVLKSLSSFLHALARYIARSIAVLSSTRAVILKRSAYTAIMLSILIVIIFVRFLFAQQVWFVCPMKLHFLLSIRVPSGLVDVVLSYCHACMCDASLTGLLPYLEGKGLGVINASALSMGLLTSQGPPEWHPAPEELKSACR